MASLGEKMQDELKKRSKRILKSQRDKAYLVYIMKCMQTGEKALNPSEFTKKWLKELAPSPNDIETP